MIRVVVTGAAGRMGTQIVRLVRATEGLALAGAVERAGAAGVGQDAGALAGLGPVGVVVQDDLAKALAGADVVVDFTSHEASAAHAELCAARGVALVIGSTGFTPEAKARVAAAARKIPIVLSPNMSVGVNVLFDLVRKAAAVLGDAYDVEIVEIHHKKKRDAPSGTAVRLGEVAAEALGRDPKDALAFSRHGILGERPPWQIGVQTLRG
ncbi:MAG TPA: 4-hydroxy-tetrahydrodipicolinate reductase, partial [Anaeromyxobacter sp.]